MLALLIRRLPSVHWGERERGPTCPSVCLPPVPTGCSYGCPGGPSPTIAPLSLGEWRHAKANANARNFLKILFLSLLFQHTSVCVKRRSPLDQLSWVSFSTYWVSSGYL
uniref:Secreted protein n=1 Tax=Electrophorus electricus TaxID=8005 RepID=A0AAY5F4G4_ELEEL